MSRATSTATPMSPQQQQGTTTGIPKDKIAMRAYEKWCKKGRPHGTDKQDWIEAENELKSEMMRNIGMQTGQGQTRR